MVKQKLIPKRGRSKNLAIESFPPPGSIGRLHRILDRVQAPLLFVDTIFRTPYVEAHPITGKRVLIAHDIFHERVASFEANGFSVSPRITAEDERSRVALYDAALAISERDAATLRSMAPHLDVKTVFPAAGANACHEPDFTAGRILYLGSKAHHNVDGLAWFIQHIWPEVLKHHPNAMLDVVGSIGSALAPAPNVVFHGRLDDFSGIARNTAFAINPVRMGSGIKVKMVDYFNAKLGCITTSAGAFGFPEEERPFISCDTKEDFARNVTAWLSCSETCKQMSEMARKYTKNFSKNAVDSVIREIIDSNHYAQRSKWPLQPELFSIDKQAKSPPGKIENIRTFQ